MGACKYPARANKDVSHCNAQSVLGLPQVPEKAEQNLTADDDYNQRGDVFASQIMGAPLWRVQNTSLRKEKVVGRPRTKIDTMEIIRLRLEGQSWPSIARKLNCGLATVYRRGWGAAVVLTQSPKANRLQREHSRPECKSGLFTGGQQ